MRQLVTAVNLITLICAMQFYRERIERTAAPECTLNTARGFKRRVAAVSGQQSSVVRAFTSFYTGKILRFQNKRWKTLKDYSNSNARDSGKYDFQNPYYKHKKLKLLLSILRSYFGAWNSSSKLFYLKDINKSSASLNHFNSEHFRSGLLVSSSSDKYICYLYLALHSFILRKKC